MEASTSPDAGWYDDPGDQSRQRFWDGSAWTEFTQASSPTDVYTRGLSPGLTEAGWWLRDHLVVALGLAGLVVAAAAAIIVLGGDTEQTAGASPDQVLAMDAAAKEQTRTAQTALEIYATDNNGSYAGATPESLSSIEPLVSGSSGLVVTAERASYSLTVESESANTFTISRAADGTLSYPCTPAGQGGCSPAGTWN